MLKKKEKKRKGSLTAFLVNMCLITCGPRRTSCSWLRCGTGPSVSSFCGWELLRASKLFNAWCESTTKTESSSLKHHVEEDSPHTCVLLIQYACWEWQRSGDISFTEDLPSTWKNLKTVVIHGQNRAMSLRAPEQPFRIKITDNMESLALPLYGLHFYSWGQNYLLNLI